MVAFNFDHVAEILRAMDVDDVERLVDLARGAKVGEYGWSDGTLAVWLKNRASLKSGVYFEPEEVVTAVLHCFPINYTETPEGLARIRNDKTTLASSVARSKVGTTNEVIHPIDSVAARVAPEE
jgi:hypothetical protein